MEWWEWDEVKSNLTQLGLHWIEFAFECAWRRNLRLVDLTLNLRCQRATSLNQPCMSLLQQNSSFCHKGIKRDRGDGGCRRWRSSFSARPDPPRVSPSSILRPPARLPPQSSSTSMSSSRPNSLSSSATAPSIIFVASSSLLLHLCHGESVEQRSVGLVASMRSQNYTTWDGAACQTCLLSPLLAIFSCSVQIGRDLRIRSIFSKKEWILLGRIQRLGNPLYTVYLHPIWPTLDSVIFFINVPNFIIWFWYQCPI